MQDSTEAMARRILESVLRQREGGAARATPVVNEADKQGAGGSPIIVIVLGDSTAAAALAGPQAGCGCQNNSPGAGKKLLESLHPGLERFDLLEDNSLSSGPRRCVVEPDRDCVGSGACEMRGF